MRAAFRRRSAGTADDPSMRAVCSRSLAAVVAAVVLAGCGSSSHSAASSNSDAASSSVPSSVVLSLGSTATTAPTTTAPPVGALTGEAASAAAGDIPDNQVFLTYADPSGWSIKYPEGWAQTGTGHDVTFRDKNNVVHIVVRPGPAPTVASVHADLAALSSATPSIRGSTPAAIRVGGTPMIKVTYTTERAERRHGQVREADRRSVRVCPFRLRRGCRPRHSGGCRQCRRLPADDRVLPVEVASLYVEPAEETPSRPPPALEAVDLFRIYRSGPVETVALRGLDLAVERGEFVALLGPSGSGKSTFLALAAGLDQPSAGEVRVFGRPLGRLTERELAEYRARQIAIVFQGDNLWPELSAEQNIRVAQRLSGAAGSGIEARSALEMFGLSDRAGVRAGSLSGGEQQRVAIAAAAARQASLVLCDEPTGELDSANEDLVIAALRRLRASRQATIVVVTHSPQLADACDRAITLRDGKVA
jgi:putative ABC transport system ATP-binding protein